MATEMDEDELRGYAAVVGNRDQFATIFDEISQGRTRKFMVLAMLNGQEPYLEALKQAHKKGFLDALLEQLAHAGVTGHSKTSVSPRLEAITRPDLGFPNVDVELTGKLTASRRLCCITVLKTPGGNPHKSGTGFLVGPQTVLTSYHVINTLLDEQDSPLPDSKDRLRVAFDELNGLSAGAVIPVHEDWLVDHSKFHPLEDPDNQKALDWDMIPEEGFDKHLDFALLRLSQTVGRERGFYRLDAGSAASVGNASAQVALLQHPEGSALASTAGAGLKLWPDSLKTRLHHNANSANGSSGGLLVNNEFKPIGLHQCSYVDAQKKPLFNGAITTSTIAKLSLPMDSVQGFDPVWMSSDEPVIGREDFQRSVLDAIGGHKRILTVSGISKMGRSFTTKILRAMLGSAEHHIVELSASKLQVTARTAAHRILAALTGEEAKVPALPDTTEAETAQAGWIGSELFPAFSQAMHKLAGHRIAWLAIDDLDRYPIANTSIRAWPVFRACVSF